MTTPEAIIRVQTYLREVARSQYQTFELPPFTLFFHPTDPFKYFSYAIPDSPCGLETSAVLEPLKAEFHRRGRTARFEFFEAFAPDLPVVLRSNGFYEEGRQWSMICTRRAFQPRPSLAGVDVTRIDTESTGNDLRDFIIAQREGFSPDHPAEVGERDVAEERENFRRSGSLAFLARVSNEPAGVSMVSRPIAGVAEIVGIATRLPYRRRGIASLLTAMAVQAAFEQGVDTACLTAEDERAGRVYERVGFTPFSIMLAYAEPGEPGS